jgi:hypothetical protein
MAGVGAAAKGLLRWVIVLGLVAVLAWLVSERNARAWILTPDDGRLVVKRGLFLPIGSAEYRPSDPALAKAYGPVVPPPGKVLPEAREFPEQPELDRALFDLLAGWAREDIASGDPTRLERGLAYLERAIELPAISSAQRDNLAALRAESGFYEARRLIEKARAELFEAAQKLRLTAGSRSARAMDADALLRELSPAIDATAAAVRVAGSSAPPPAPPPAAAPSTPEEPPKAANKAP